jgi:HAD superfamily hydrolase (TIGR01509 family)
MVRAIIFDADHTLYEPQTEKAYDRKFGYLADQLGLDEERLRDIWNEQVAEVLGSLDPDERHRKRILAQTLAEMELSPAGREDIVDEALERFWDQVVEDLSYEDGVPQMLDELRDRGIELVAVASDEFREPLERKLNRVFGDWNEYFHHMVTPRDTESMKPSEQFFEMILERGDLEPSETVVVGDSWERDLAPAKELGMKTVLVAERSDGEPDATIAKLSDLDDVLDQL